MVFYIIIIIQLVVTIQNFPIGQLPLPAPSQATALTYNKLQHRVYCMNIFLGVILRTTSKIPRTLWTGKWEKNRGVTHNFPIVGSMQFYVYVNKFVLTFSITEAYTGYHKENVYVRIHHYHRNLWGFYFIFLTKKGGKFLYLLQMAAWSANNERKCIFLYKPSIKKNCTQILTFLQI